MTDSSKLHMTLFQNYDGYNTPVGSFVLMTDHGDATVFPHLPFPNPTATEPCSTLASSPCLHFQHSKNSSQNCFWSFWPQSAGCCETANLSWLLLSFGNPEPACKGSSFRISFLKSFSCFNALSFTKTDIFFNKPKKVRKAKLVHHSSPPHTHLGC